MKFLININNKTKQKKYITDFSSDIFIYPFVLVRLLGVEPRTSWSVAKRSIQLSYRRDLLKYFSLIFNLYL